MNKRKGWAFETMFGGEYKLTTLHEIAIAVCHAFDVGLNEIRSRRRSRPLTLPRQLICYLARHHARMRLTAIAHFIRRDHSTVIHSIHVINNEMSVDPRFRAVVLEIIANLPDIETIKAA